MKSSKSLGPRSGRETAYTLAEVLIAVGVIGAGVISLYACFTTGFSIMQQTRENLRATQILMQRMETIRLYTWSQVNDRARYTFREFTELYDPLSTNQVHGVVFSGTLSVDLPPELSTGYRANMRLVTVSLRWTNTVWGKQMVHSRQMHTYVAQRGMQSYVIGNSP